MGSVIISDSMSILQGSASRVNSTTEAEAPPPRKIDYKKEVVFYFFTNMLEAIVESWEAEGIMEKLESIDSGNNLSRARECLMDVEIVSDEEIMEAEDQQMSVKLNVSEQGVAKVESKPKVKKSSVSSTKKGKTRRSRKSTRKLTSVSEKETTIQIIDDNSWMIEPVEETAMIVFRNGNVYEGPLSGNLMEGTGKFTWANGTTYVGDFKAGELTGNGILTLPDINRYSGSFLNGYRHGEGEMAVKESEASYSGSWRAGKKHGHGWQLFGPNNWYDGLWENDAMSGKGNRQYPSGGRYEGEWKNSMRNGKGIAVMKNNDYYTGDWKDGKRSGYGEYTWSSFYNKTFSVPVQCSYIGCWENDNRHGIGVVNFGTEGGSRYAGCFENNLKHGPGVVICENGSTIESNPMFLDDKPIHLTKTGSYISEEDIVNANATVNSTDNLIISAINDFPQTCINEYVQLERRMSIFKTVSKVIHQPGDFLDNATLANIELCKMIFPKIKENHFSLCIPVNTPSELINLNHHLMKTVELKDDTFYLAFSKLTLPVGLKHDSIKAFCCDESSPARRTSETTSITFTSEMNKLYIEHEEKNIRKAITSHLPRLRAIYHHYTIVSSLKDVPFKTLLIRLFLWQFYRDCMIPEKGVSLIKIGSLLAENPDIELETEQNPFEVIYFWQFLHSLLAVALNLYGKECSFCVHEGTLTSAFVKLLEEDIYPNYGHHKGCLLFDYVDVLPLKAAYRWFMEFKQPFTVLNFLQISSTIKHVDPPSYFAAKDEDFSLEMGINAYAIAHEIKYLKDDVPSFPTEPIPKEETIKRFDKYKGIFFLRTLGAKKVLSIISEICPKVMEGKDIVDIQHQMTFYEFYESVLKCTEAYIEKREKEAKLKEKEGSISPLTVALSTRKRTRKGTYRKLHPTTIHFV